MSLQAVQLLSVGRGVCGGACGRCIGPIIRPPSMSVRMVYRTNAFYYAVVDALSKAK